MATPDEVTVWIGLDVGKEEHFADVLDDHGDPLFAKSIGNDEADLVGLLDRALEDGCLMTARGPSARVEAKAWALPWHHHRVFSIVMVGFVIVVSVSRFALRTVVFLGAPRSPRQKGS